MIYTVQFKKPGATFVFGLDANADRVAGVPAAILEEYHAIDDSLISQGVIESPETYSWDQETQILTVTRDINDVEKYLAAKVDIAPKIYEAGVANGWTRIKQMIPL